MKIVVIYHNADFDGIFCREIAKKALGEKDVEAAIEMLVDLIVKNYL